MQGIKAAIRSYIIGIIADMVAADIIANGLTDADRALIDERISAVMTG